VALDVGAEHAALDHPALRKTPRSEPPVFFALGPHAAIRRSVRFPMIAPSSDRRMGARAMNDRLGRWDPASSMRRSQMAAIDASLPVPLGPGECLFTEPTTAVFAAGNRTGMPRPAFIGPTPGKAPEGKLDGGKGDEGRQRFGAAPGQQRDHRPQLRIAA
jgi:hypothetical protein